MKHLNQKVMAKQVGLVLLEGSIGELCFYKSQGVYRVRRKGGISGKKIKSDPRFELTRQNMAEFATAVKAAYLLKNVVRSIMRCNDKGASRRLTSCMSKVIKADVVNKRGERTVKWGRPELLQGFEFNQDTSLANAFFVGINASIDRETGKIKVDLPEFSPATTIEAPQGATHFRLHAGAAAIDFEKGTYDLAKSKSDLISIGDQVVRPLQFALSTTPASSDPLFVVFGIEFVTIVNREELPLGGARGNAMVILRVEE